MKHLSATAFRGVVFSTLWWVLTGGMLQSWGIGIPAVLIALVASLALIPPTNFKMTGLGAFLPVFVIRSLKGGIDVAWRAFHVRLPLNPGIIEYDLRLEGKLPRVVMVNVVGLLPGTLGVEMTHDMLLVHVIDAREEILAELASIEQSIANIFSLNLSNNPVVARKAD